jgi:preprotein translocase subunit SecG
MFEVLVTVVHIITCFFLIMVILLQAGRGGGVSAAFGGGAGAALGQRAAATVLGKVTSWAAGTFMVTSMVLAIYSSPSANDPTKKFAEENPGAPVTQAAPVTEAEAPVLDPGEAPAPATDAAPVTDAAPATEAAPATDAAPRDRSRACQRSCARHQRGVAAWAPWAPRFPRLSSAFARSGPRSLRASQVREVPTTLRPGSGAVRPLGRGRPTP